MEYVKQSLSSWRKTWCSPDIQHQVFTLVTETEPGPDGIPVHDPSQTFFKSATRPVQKVENDWVLGT